jgi:hypothetical protein
MALGKARTALAAERGARLDQRIVDAWALHRDAEPDISTERLMEMVRGDTGADPDRQIQALRRAGLLKRKE